MQALRLQKEVAVEGPDFWGRRARIRFTPSKTPGWYWRPHKKAGAVAITKEIVQHNKNRLVLACRENRLHVYEHIGVLRFLGVEGVIIESPPWPPYHGRALELWNALKEHCIESTQEIEWCTPLTYAGWKYSGTALNRYTFIKPLQKPELHIEIIVEYRTLGYKKLTVTLPHDRAILLKALEVYSQGWPLWRYNISRAASFLGWPHHNQAIWPQEHEPRETIELFALHRLVDLLGDFSAVDNARLLAGTIISKCSGHEADVRTMQSLEIRPLK